jgi:hypothetical protein
VEIETPSRRVRPGLTEMLVVLGGAAAAVGAFLEWFRVRINLKNLATVSRTVSSNAPLADRNVVVGAAVVAIVGGLLMWVWRTDRARAVLGVLALLGGLVAGGLAGFDAVTSQERFIEANAPKLARNGQVTLTMAKRLYQGLFDSGALKMSLAVGIYLAIAGGVVAMAAAAFALGKSADEPMEPA